MAVGPKLRRCESCRRLFVMARPHQRLAQRNAASGSAWRSGANKSATRSGRTTYAGHAEGQGKATRCARDAPKEEGSLTMGESTTARDYLVDSVLPRWPAA